MANKQIEKMLQGLNILVVDDNAYMRRLTRTMLTNLGGRSVLEASDGLAALESIRTADPDVMLLDWDMPVLNGIEVLRIVRSPGVFPRPNLPVIMLTARAQGAHVNEALRAGANEFLLKPTSPQALWACPGSSSMTSGSVVRIDSSAPRPSEASSTDLPPRLVSIVRVRHRMYALSSTTRIFRPWSIFSICLLAMKPRTVARIGRNLCRSFYCFVENDR